MNVLCVRGECREFAEFQVTVGGRIVRFLCGSHTKAQVDLEAWFGGRIIVTALKGGVTYGQHVAVGSR